MQNVQRALQDAQKLLQTEQLCLQCLNTTHDILLTRTGAQNMLNFRQPIINPQSMHQDYGSRVCVSVCYHASATYLVCKSKLWYYKVPYGVLNT